MFPLLILLLLLGPVCYTTAAAVSQTAASINPFALTTVSYLPFSTVLPSTSFNNNASVLAQQVHQPDNETIASYSESGLCFVYLSHMFPGTYKDGWNRDKELEPCKNYCQKDDATNGYGVSHRFCIPL